MKSLIEFIQEQDLVNYRRLSGQSPPWTDDQVMASYKFGNVRREFDRTNRFLYHLFRNRSLKQSIIVANCLVHRLISCHDFSEQYGLFRNFKDFERAYKKDRSAGLPVRPTSFISCKSDPDLLKSAELCFTLTAALAEIILDSTSLESVFFHFKKVVGKFTAWQAALDCAMYGWVTNSTDFIHMGPGADFTLRALDMGPEDYDVLVEQVNDHLRYLPLRYEEVEGLLCEYGRYLKYNTKWPGKYRNYTPDPRPLLPVPLDNVLLMTIALALGK